MLGKVTPGFRGGGGGGGGGEVSHIRRMGCSMYPLVVKKPTVKVLSLEMSTTGAFAVPCRVLSRKKNMLEDNLL